MPTQPSTKKNPALQLPPAAPPVLQPHATATVKSYKAYPLTQQKLNFPEQLPNDWQEQAIKKLAELLKTSRNLRTYLDSCVKCGACADKCQFFIGTGDPNNMPVARQDLLRNVYKRYFTWSGKWFPKLVGAIDLTPEVLESWYIYYYQCSQCRRCAVFCPYGIDTAEIAMAAREILNSLGQGQRYCNEIIEKAETLGNNLGLPAPALKHTLAFLEEDLEEETGGSIRLPLDEAGVDILLVTPSADFFAEPHIEGFLGYAKVFHQAGLSWTVSTLASEAANFGLFIGNPDHMAQLALRIKQAAKKLGVKRIVFGECGHAWRVAHQYFPQLVGEMDFLDPDYPIPQHICELTYDLLQAGRLTLDKSANADYRVTFHDSCNIARSSRLGTEIGGQFDIPRALLKAVCDHVYDMPEESIKEKTFCCGGGGGLLTDELLPVRIKGALPRMRALQHVVSNHDVTHLVSICAICKSQFSKVLPEYGFKMDQVLSLHQLVGNALVFEQAHTE